MRKNILLLILVLVLSLIVAPYFGILYDKLSPQYGNWTGDKEDAVFFSGMIVSYVVLIPFLLELLGSENRKKWILWLLLPAALLWIFADIYFIYVPIVLVITGFILAKLIRFVASKFRRPNPTMIIR